MTELKVSARTPAVGHLILGTAGFGCTYKEIPEEQCRATLDKALEFGIRYIDTAPWYGAGVSEARIGNALEGRWNGVRISTKCGRVIKRRDQITAADNEEKGYLGGAEVGGIFFTANLHNDKPCWDYTADGVREAVRQSLARLKVDRLQDLRLHDAESEERFSQCVEGGGIEAMVALKEAGTVERISLGMNDPKFLLRFLQKYPGTFDSIMMAGSFNLIDNDSVDLLLECQKQGVRVANVGIFASGVLWGGDHYRYGCIPEAVKQQVAKWQALADKYSLSLPQVAMNFALLPDIVEYIAFGACRPEEVEANVNLLGKSVPVELWAEAKEQGLIDPRVPLPAAPGFCAIL